ncbi:MAG: transposase [Spirochaetes bacterium]|nr:transposase [Spirochaetota bacterium]
MNGSIRETGRSCDQTGEAQRIFRDIRYKTQETWNNARRVVAKAEHLPDGSNPRFIVTNLDRTSWETRELYENLYCARGNMENRIKERKLFMFADRLSSHAIRAGQLRLWFSTFALLFTVFLGNQNADDPLLATLQASTIRTKFLKVATQVSASMRRIVIHVPEALPYWNTWLGIRERLLT